MNARKKQQESTRRAILEALAAVISESGTTAFSVQEVADRAGVTHRTVYKHFPTREALNDGLARHVEEELANAFGGGPLDADLTFERIPEFPLVAFPLFDELDARVRAYVMLMVASRAPAAGHRERTASLERLLECEAGPLPEGTGRVVAGALRMMFSAWTWHLMTEHIGLSSDETSRATAWALDAMVTAVKNGNLPKTGAEE